jgi:acetoin utilization protein AcuB
MPTQQPTVREYMTPDPATIDGGLSVADARTRMFQLGVRHLPVYVGGHLVGVLSDRDLARVSANDGVETPATTVEQACTPNPYVVGPNTSLAEVAQVLADNKFGAALVMEGGHLLGVFTVVDALRALVTYLHPVGGSLDLTAVGLDDSMNGHTPDARHDALLNQQTTRDHLAQPGQGVRVGIDNGTGSVDIHSDVGRRSEMRRAARTVYGRDDEPGDTSTGTGTNKAS